jgi:predicted Holliday junction resolvase-like endonuclease
VDLAVVVLAVALVILGVAFILVVRYLLKRIDDGEKRAQDAEKRADRAPKLSRAINMGKIGEQFAPLLPGFPYAFKDVQWVGGKVDAIVWNGLEAVKSGQGSPDEVEVVLLEVKTGNHARLDGDQRLIRAAAEAGRMRFEEFRFRPELEDDMLPIEVIANPEFILLDGDPERADSDPDQELG